MSQVRKFDKGGSTAESTEKKSYHDNKYGHYIVDGKTYDVNDDFINNYITSAKKFNDAGTNRIASYVVNALKSGQDVSFDTLNNRVTGINQYLNADDITRSNEYYSGSQNKKMQRKYQRKEINKNTDLHQTNVGIKNLGSIQFIAPQETVSTPDLINLYGENRTLDYNKNSDGSVTWSTGPQNAGNIASINNFFDFLGMSNEEADKKYSYKGKENWISDLRNWYKNNQNYKEGLISRIQSNQLNENDWDLLSRMGFVRDESYNDSTSSASTTQPRSYEGSGFNNDALEQAGYYVKKDKDGNVYLYDNSGNVVQDKIYLKGTPWANGTQWENGAVYKGRFITADELLNQNSEVNRDFQSWVNAGYATDELGDLLSPDQIRELRDQTGWKYEGYSQQSPFSVTYDRSRQTLNGFDNIFTDPNQYYIADLTPQYNINDGTQIISFLNQSNKRDKDGVLNPYYAVSGVDQIFKTQEELQNYLNSRNITARSGVLGQSNLNIRNYFDQDGRRYVQSNKTVKIGDKRFDIFRDQDGLYYVRGLDKKGNPNFIQLSGRNIMNKIINNQPITHDELLKGRAEEDRRSTAGNIWNWTWLGLGNDVSRNTDWYNAKEYDKALGFKKGGKVPILQYGGMFSRVNNNVKTTKASENRVGEASKAFGEQKELKTSADKWAKAAGFLDTAGAAATFIPGYGNIAGAITGLAGSIARFASDAKRDGLDWGDARRLLTNIGLDVLTLIPGAGTAAKAAKIGKAAKSTKILNSVGKILRNTAKPLSVAGAAGGIATAAGAIADNDGEFTSEDFAQLGQGLLGTVGGFKNINRLNKEAKLVKEIVGDIKVGKTYSKEELATLPWFKRQFTKAKQNITSTKNNSANDMSARWLAYRPWKQDELLDVVIKKGNVDLKKLATGKNGELDESKLAALQNILGRRLTEVGVTNLRINPWWMNTNQFKMDKSLAGYTSLNKANVARVGRQMLSKMYHSGVTDLNTAKNYIVKNLSSDKQAYWLDLLNNRSKDFEKLFKNLNKTGKDAAQRVKLFDSFKFQKGGKIIKAQSGIKMPFGTFVQDNSLADPNLYDYSKSGIQFNGSNVDWTKTYGQGLFTDLRNYYLNNWDNEAFKPIRDAYLSQLSTGNNNVDLANFTKDDFARLTQDQKLGYAHNLWTNQLRDYLYDTGNIFKMSGMNINNNKDMFVPYLNPDGTKMTMQQTHDYLIGRGVPEEQVKEYVSRNASKFANSYDGTELETAVVTVSPKESTSTDSKTSSTTKSTEDDMGNNPEGKTKKPFNFNFNPDDLIGLGQMIGNITANNKMYNRLEEGIKSLRGTMEAMPTEIYDRYQDHITPIYQEAANQKRQFFVPTSTDAVTNYAMRQANEDQAQALLTEGRLKASEAYSQYLDKDLAARRTYADERRRVGQSNRERMANISMQLAQNDAARRLSNWQSINNGILEFRNKLAQDRQRKIDFMKQEDSIMAQRKYDEYINKKMAEGDYYNQFNALDADKKKQYLNAQDWLMQTNPDIYNNIINGASVEALNYTRANRPKYLDYFRIDTTPLSIITPSSPVSMPAYMTLKKGGKTPTYLKRHTGQKPDEAIWIQRNKDTAKALEKLHDAVIKLFMKTLS